MEICRKNDILYISDEVVTAFGRLGEFFASKKIFDIEPDNNCSKGITSGYVPLGGVLISDRLMEEIKSEKILRDVFEWLYLFISSGVVRCCAKEYRNNGTREYFWHVQSVHLISKIGSGNLRSLR